MPETKICPTCKGAGEVEVLKSMHDDAKETVQCWNCHGKGEIYQMTEEEERDYMEDWW